MRNTLIFGPLTSEAKEMDTYRIQACVAESWLEGEAPETLLPRIYIDGRALCTADGSKRHSLDEAFVKQRDAIRREDGKVEPGIAVSTVEERLEREVADEARAIPDLRLLALRKLHQEGVALGIDDPTEAVAAATAEQEERKGKDDFDDEDTLAQNN